MCIGSYADAICVVGTLIAESKFLILSMCMYRSKQNNYKQLSRQTGGDGFYSNKMGAVRGHGHPGPPLDVLQQWRIQDFPQEGVPTAGGAPAKIIPIFHQNPHEIKEIWSLRRGACRVRPSLDPPLYRLQIWTDKCENSINIQMKYIKYIRHNYTGFAIANDLTEFRLI